MPARSRELIEDAQKISIQSLYRSGTIQRGQFSDGILLGRYRFSAFLGQDGRGFLEIGQGKWAIESRSLRRNSRKTYRGIMGGLRLYIRGSNGKRHLYLFITHDGRAGTQSELRLIWATKRMRKAKRVLYRRMKLLRRLEGKPYSWEWVRAHPDYTPKKPHGMSRKRFRRLVNGGIYYVRKRTPTMLNRKQTGVDDIEFMKRVFG